MTLLQNFYLLEIDREYVTRFDGVLNKVGQLELILPRGLLGVHKLSPLGNQMRFYAPVKDPRVEPPSTPTENGDARDDIIPIPSHYL